MAQKGIGLMSENRTPILIARGLVKRFGRVTALDHADFDLYPGEILAVIGDNGAGKSTLIKAIELGGRDVTYAAPKDRDIAMVFQSYALYPNMNVAQNIAFG